MSRRAVFSILNTAILAAALVLFFLLPQYATYTLYAIVGWVAAGLTLTWSGWTSAGTTGPGSASPGVAGAVTAGRRDAPPIDFCVFCGRRFAVGERICPECRHPLPLASA